MQLQFYSSIKRPREKGRVGRLQCLDAEMLQAFHCDDAKAGNPEVTSYILGKKLGADLDETWVYSGRNNFGAVTNFVPHACHDHTCPAMAIDKGC